MLTYLGDKRWSDISREERLFCAELFFEIRGREPAFVEWLNGRPGTRGLELHAAQPWEAAFEVCFYRDLMHAAGTSAPKRGFPPKRTFDLCLFAPSDIVIIEAKAAEAFEGEPNETFERDRRDVLRAIADAGHDAANVRVSVIALASSRYFTNVEKYGAGIPKVFDGHFSWKDLHETFAARELFARADSVYKR